MTTIVMVHGVGGTAEAFSRLAPAFRDMGWRVETPTLRAGQRTAENPPADLHRLRLKDYIEDIAALASQIEAETGVAPVLFGHSMGGLVVQKVIERGIGRAAVLITPASPGDCRSGSSLAQAFTFANVLFSGKPETRSHKIWRTGFSWGVLNRVPQAKHAGIFAGTVYDSGGVYHDLAYPDRDPDRTAYVDETRISVPILVIGGGRDRATPIADVRKVAAKYARVGGAFREYPENAHWIVDEPGTDRVIADIEAWMTGAGVTPAAPAPAAKAAAAKSAPANAAPKARTATKTSAPAASAKAKAAKPTAAKPAPTAPKPESAPVAKVKAKAPAASAPAKTARPAAKPKPVGKVAPKVAPAAKAPAKAKTSVRKPKSS